MKPHIHSTTHRPTLLGSSAAFVLLFAATGAQAQTSGATATAPRSLASAQSATGHAFSDASDTSIRSIVVSEAEHADIRLDANLISAAARANAASLTLPGDGLNDAAPDVPAATAGPAGASARADIAIAARQSMGAVTAQSDMLGSEISAQVEAPTASRITVGANALETRALGNDLSASLRLDQSAGAAIALSQSTATGSAVSANSRGAYGLVATDTMISTLSLTGNVDRAIATGNRVGSSLTVDSATVQVGDATDTTSVVPVTTGSDATSSAVFALATHQNASGTVQATTADQTGRPTFALVVQGSLAGSSAALDANILATTARGNDAEHAIALDAGSIEPSSTSIIPSGVAAITNVQKAPGLTLFAVTGGGAQLTIRGHTSNSDVSASGNVARTFADANQSKNSLTAIAASIDGLSGRAIASVDADGLSTADAGLTLHNVQDFALSSVSAMHTGSRTGIVALAGMDGVRIAATANDQGVRASGNDTSNLIAAEAGSLATSFGLNSLQSGNGEVGAMLGAVVSPSGATIVKSGPVENSALAVTDNRLAATAIGNSGTNEIENATGLLGGSGSDAVSGPMGNAYGATADVVLASNQKLGEAIGSTTVTPIIRGRVASQFGITGAGSITGSSLVVADNHQQSSAIGNSGINRLAVTAASLSEGMTAPATSLASSQYGQAAINSVSRAQFVVEGPLADSEASISGNTSAALGVINDADNRLEVSGAAGATAGSASSVASDAMGPPLGTGAHVVTSQQFASGSVNATAATQIGDLSAGTSLDTGRYVVTDNRTDAEASANRATNLVRSDVSGSALVNTQVNLAASTASASGGVNYRIAAPSAIQAGSLSMDGNAIAATARGNAADNQLEFGSIAAGAPARSIATRFDASTEGSAALANVQSNLGGVIASAIDTSVLVALNAPSAGGSAISLTNTTVTASAYGNIASNSIAHTQLGMGSGVGIANLQTNSSNITANVTRASVGSGAMTLPGIVSLNGNQIAATAVGNQVISTIASPR